METKIAFLGMGVMGGPMAANLAKEFSNVHVWNRTPGRPGELEAREAGATSSSTLEACVKDAQFIFTCLGDVSDVEEILVGSHGIIQHAPNSSCVIDTTTIGPDPCQKIARILSDKGIGFLDAPVSGGDTGARNGTLTFMVGGEADLLERTTPFLNAMGSNVFHCGPSGSGQSVKLCNQIFCALHALAFSEALALAEGQGISAELMLKVCATGAAGSWALNNLAPRAAQRDFEPGFMIRHMRKDLGLVLSAAQSTLNTAALPGTTLATNLYKQLVEKDDSADAQGTQALFRLYANEESSD